MIAELQLPLAYKEHSTQPEPGSRTYRLILRLTARDLSALLDQNTLDSAGHLKCQLTGGVVRRR